MNWLETWKPYFLRFEGGFILSISSEIERISLQVERQDDLISQNKTALNGKVSNAIPIATQATPVISVSNSGLITATATQTSGYVSAGTKSATRQLSTQGAQTITPGTSDFTIPAQKFLTGIQTIKGDPNLLAENIKDGVSIFDVLGTMATGQSGEGDAAVKQGAITIASGTSVTICHGLGKTPIALWLYTLDTVAKKYVLLNILLQLCRVFFELL